MYLRAIVPVLVAMSMAAVALAEEPPVQDRGA